MPQSRCHLGHKLMNRPVLAFSHTVHDALCSEATQGLVVGSASRPGRKPAALTGQ